MTMFAIDGKPGKVRRGEGDGASGESARESYPGSEGGFLGFEGLEEGVGGHGVVGRWVGEGQWEMVAYWMDDIVRLWGRSGGGLQ